MGKSFADAIAECECVSTSEEKFEALNTRSKCSLGRTHSPSLQSNQFNCCLTFTVTGERSNAEIFVRPPTQSPRESRAECWWIPKSVFHRCSLWHVLYRTLSASCVDWFHLDVSASFWDHAVTC